MAEEWKLRTGGNPCRFVRKYPETKRERLLTDEEFRRVGEVLDGMEAEGRLPAHPAAAIRLLMLTGCRRNETVELQWKDVDLGAGELRLRDSKSGARLVPLSPASARVLAELPRVEGNPLDLFGVLRRLESGEKVSISNLRIAVAPQSLEKKRFWLTLDT